jgi:rsbT co-antagonist protein RsbR
MELEIYTDHERALRRQNDVLSSLLKVLPIGVFMVEVPSGKPLVANQAALELLGRGILPDATQENISAVYKAFKQNTNSPYPVDEMPIIRGMGGEVTHVDDMVVERSNGTRVLLEVFGAPVLDEQGAIWASLASFIDITERKKTEENLGIHQIELEMQNEELRVAHQELDNARLRYFDLYNLAPGVTVRSMNKA